MGVTLHGGRLTGHEMRSGKMYLKSWSAAIGAQSQMLCATKTLCLFLLERVCGSSTQQRSVVITNEQKQKLSKVEFPEQAMYGVSIHICSDENADSNRTLKTYFILILSHNALRPSSQPSKKFRFQTKPFVSKIFLLTWTCEICQLRCI